VAATAADNELVGSSTIGGVNRPHRFLQRRIVWHTLGVIVALAVAWMIFRAYRQPGFMLDLSNFLLC
jgi:hypothetical protein